MDALSPGDVESAQVPAKRAAEIAGISPQRLHYWEETGLIAPRVRRKLGPRTIVRLYSFERLVELMVAAALVRQKEISLQHLRRVLRYLREQHDYKAPLRELTFAVLGDEIFFQHPDGDWEGSRRPAQVVIRQVLNLDEIRQVIRDRLRRRPDQLGRVEKRRKVMGSKPVFAGTRVPAEAVLAFIESGASDKEILAAYPSLTLEDLEAARHRGTELLKAAS